MQKIKLIKKKHFPVFLLLGLLVLSFAFALFGPRLFHHDKVYSDTSQESRYVTTARGYVESTQDIKLASQIPGIIKEMRVDKGAQVVRGQTLVILDDVKIREQIGIAESQCREAEVRLQELRRGYRNEEVEIAQSRERKAQTIYAYSEREFKRAERLFLVSAVPFTELEHAEEKLRVVDQELKEAKANLMRMQKGFRDEEIERAEATLDQVRSNLRYQRALLADYTIKSPIAGIVIDRYRDTHETVVPGTQILAIVNQSSMRIRAELEESEIGKVKVGQSAEVTTDMLQGKSYRGKVSMVVQAIKRKTIKPFDPPSSLDVNTQEIHLILEDYSGLTNGMTVTVRFLR